VLTEPDTRSIRREATRERILKAAWKLARNEGITSFTLRDLAKAVGMRAPSLYSYFDSKHALYDAMFAQGNRELAAMVDDLPAGALAELLPESAKRWITFGVSDPARFQLLFQRTIPGFEPSPESYATAVDVFERMRARFHEAGFDDGAMDLWTCITSGIASQQLANDPGGDRYTRLTDQAVAMFLAHAKRRKGQKGRAR
jgi:AcrR family transcriptional regulator